jgi:hypothetical protein
MAQGAGTIDERSVRRFCTSSLAGELRKDNETIADVGFSVSPSGRRGLLRDAARERRRQAGAELSAELLDAAIELRAGYARAVLDAERVEILRTQQRALERLRDQTAQVARAARCRRVRRAASAHRNRAASPAPGERGGRRRRLALALARTRLGRVVAPGRLPIKSTLAGVITQVADRAAQPAPGSGRRRDCRGARRWRAHDRFARGLRDAVRHRDPERHHAGFALPTPW